MRRISSLSTDLMAALSSTLPPRAVLDDARLPQRRYECECVGLGLTDGRGGRWQALRSSIAPYASCSR